MVWKGFHEGGDCMVQRTLFNKLTLDRIDEVFTYHFPDGLPGQIICWREELQAGSTEGRQFYISVNDQYEMEGIMLYESSLASGVLYACTPEAVLNLLERVIRTGQLRSVTGDSQSVKWAESTDLLTV